MIYTEITKLTDKTTGNEYNIKTECKIYFICKIVHVLTVRKLKKYLKFLNRWR